MSQGRLSKQRLRLWVRWLRASRQIELEVREMLRVDFQCTLPRFDVLAALQRAGKPMTMSAISEQLLVSNGNVTTVVDRLEADGLVTRQQHAHDRRTLQVRLTRSGRTLFARMAAANEALVNGKLSVFSSAELDQLNKLMQRVT